MMELNDHMLGTYERGHHDSYAVIYIVARDNLKQYCAGLCDQMMLFIQ